MACLGAFLGAQPIQRPHNRPQIHVVPVGRIMLLDFFKGDCGKIVPAVSGRGPVSRNRDDFEGCDAERIVRTSAILPTQRDNRFHVGNAATPARRAINLTAMFWEILQDGDAPGVSCKGRRRATPRTSSSELSVPADPKTDELSQAISQFAIEHGAFNLMAHWRERSTSSSSMR